MELGVLDPEWHPVGEQQPGAPVARAGKTGNEPDQAEDHAHDEPPPWLDDLPIRLKALLLRRDRALRRARMLRRGRLLRRRPRRDRQLRRPEPVGEPDVDADDGHHEDAGEAEKPPLAAVRGAEYRGVAAGADQY